MLWLKAFALQATADSSHLSASQPYHTVFEEEYPSPGLHSQTEHFAFLQLSAMGVFAAWAFGGITTWAVGYLICLGILTPVIIEGHRRLGHFSFDAAWTRFLIASTPFWASLIIYLVGLFNQPLQLISIGDYSLISLRDTSSYLPAETVPLRGCFNVLLLGTTYLSAIGLIFVTLTVTLLRRLLLVLCINASLVALLGVIQLYAGADGILWSFSTEISFFSVFTHSEHFAGFALLWSLAYLGLLLHLRRQEESIFHQWMILLTVSWLLLAATAFWTGTFLHRSLLVLGLGWCFITEGSFSYYAGRRKRGSVVTLLGILAAMAGIAIAVIPYISSDANLLGISWESQQTLWRDAWVAFMAKPVFGWGTGSYSTVLTIYQEVDFGQTVVLTPYSDLLHLLVEQGIIGALLWLLPPFLLFVFFIRLKARRLLSCHLWVTALLIGILALVSFPLQNPATLWSLWIIVAIAHAWSRVQAVNPIEVLRNTHIVFDQSEMERIEKLSQPRGTTQSRVETRGRSS